MTTGTWDKLRRKSSALSSSSESSLVSSIGPAGIANNCSSNTATICLTNSDSHSSGRTAPQGHTSNTPTAVIAAGLEPQPARSEYFDTAACTTPFRGEALSNQGFMPAMAKDTPGHNQGNGKSVFDIPEYVVYT
ncbi:hypothetical protein BSLG_000738 [Batrachochytrium salamandrivorans]|nr:hypothetical protein BSLG_000738 [Batrachochytrium salamandrivorans]